MDAPDFKLSDIMVITVFSDPLTAIDHNASGGSTITDGDSDHGSCDHCSSHGDHVYLDNLSDGDLRVIYRMVVNYFNDLPQDLFVAQFVRDYSTLETDLKRVRDTYFDHLKFTKDSLPFGPDTFLKRRMFIRTGEPVYVRLTQDIHSIIEVTAGGDPSILKYMISNTNAKSRRTTRTPDIGYRRRLTQTL